MRIAGAALVAAAAAAAAGAVAASPFNSLKDDRASGRLVFVPMTAAEKRLLVEQTQRVLDVWVHRDEKRSFYGAVADPVPAVRALAARVPSVTDAELQLGIARAFTAARDLHTTFRVSGPYGCFTATTGVWFDMVEADNRGGKDKDKDKETKPSAAVPRSKVIVMRKTLTDPVIDFLGRSEFDKIEPADELVAIDGLSFEEWFKRNQFVLGGGAGEAGGRRRAMDWLTLADGSLGKLPDGDSVRFSLRKANGTRYEATLQYASLREPFCWQLSSGLYAAVTNTTLPGPPDEQGGDGSGNGSDSGSNNGSGDVSGDDGTPRDDGTHGDGSKNGFAPSRATGKPLRPKIPRVPLALLEDRTAYARKLLDPPGLSSVAGESSPLQNQVEAAKAAAAAARRRAGLKAGGGKSEPDTRTLELHGTYALSIAYGIWDPAGKNLGVLVVKSFQPQDPNTGNVIPDIAVSVVRSVLGNELSNTSAVVIDVRDNPGGAIDFAEKLPQLFVSRSGGSSKRGFEPPGWRFRRNNVTANVFVRGQPATDEWRRAYEQAPAGSAYTNLAHFTTVAQANRIGQAYVRPVGVLTNGRCYSACDMFAANMQDVGAATIFGEDASTGAGGANVLAQTQLVAIDGSDFALLPQAAALSPNGVNTYGASVTVAARQVVRSGRYAGRLVEDAGVKSDVVVRARASDVVGDTVTFTQLDRIADALRAIGARTGQNELHFVAEPLTIEGTASGFEVVAQTAGMDAVRVEAEGSGAALCARRGINVGGGRRSTSRLACAALQTGLGSREVEVVGTRGGREMVRARRVVRTVPAAGGEIRLKTGEAAVKVVGNGASSAAARSVGIYNGIGVSAADGWALQRDGTFAVGASGTYAAGVDSEVEAFVLAPAAGANVTVTVDATYETAAGMDFVYVSARFADGSEQQLVSTTTPTGFEVPGATGAGRVAAAFTVAARTQRLSVSVRLVSDAYGASGAGGGSRGGARLAALSVAA